MRPVKGTADIPSMSKTNENTSNVLLEKRVVILLSTAEQIEPLIVRVAIIIPIKIVPVLKVVFIYEGI